MYPLCFLATNPIADAYISSDLFGKLIFVSLFGLSTITWLVFLQKLLQNRRANQGKRLFFDVLEKRKENLLVADSKPEKAHPFYTITETLKEIALPIVSKRGFIPPIEKEVIAAHLYTAIAKEAKLLKSNLAFLSITVSLAPFLGLLGTVWGILVTFAQLQRGADAASSQAVIGGLSMALGTTVCGLVVAIPALIAYTTLKTKATDLTIEMEDYANLLIAYLEVGYGPK